MEYYFFQCVHIHINYQQLANQKKCHRLGFPNGYRSITIVLQ